MIIIFLPLTPGVSLSYENVRPLPPIIMCHGRDVSARVFLLKHRALSTHTFPSHLRPLSVSTFEQVVLIQWSSMIGVMPQQRDCMLIQENVAQLEREEYLQMDLHEWLFTVFHVLVMNLIFEWYVDEGETNPIAEEVMPA